MTLCAMDEGHKFLAYKNAMNNNYKMQNFITAANFARLVLELEPSGVRIYSKIYTLFIRYLQINLTLSLSSRSISRPSSKRELMLRSLTMILTLTLNSRRSMDISAQVL